ncbi:MAG: hypothetical protein ACN6OP_04500 [Pseudomonadales bacterium]|uniref:hypothetical protein n=1 Tax=unclassified Cupriavidus TaxID=2640874 RepID=UPI003D0CA9AB
MKRRRFSDAELIAEFVRIQGSGIPQDELGKDTIRRKVIRSLRAHLSTQARRIPARPRFDPTVIDHKRRQANDLD